MTTKAHQLAARVASGDWLSSRTRMTPMTPEQQALADEWAAAWKKAQDESILTGLAVRVVAPPSKEPSRS